MKRGAAAGGPRTVTLRRFGRLLPGLVIVVAAWAALEIPLEADRVELVAFAMAGGVALFFALMVLQATMCFWTTESLELMNILTYGGVETASYRLPIATGCSGIFCIHRSTAVYLLLSHRGRTRGGRPARDLAHVPGGSALAGFAFLGVAMGVWQLGVRRNTSTGS